MSRALLLAAIFAGTAQSAPAWCESPSAFVEQSALCAERDDETYDLDFLTDAPATWCEHRNIQSTFSLPFDDPSLPCWEDDDGADQVGTSCMPLPFEGIAPSCDGDGDDSQCTQISDGALVGGSSESTLALTTATGQVVIVDLNADGTSSFAAGGGAPLRGFGAGRVGVNSSLLVWGAAGGSTTALSVWRADGALCATLEARAPVVASLAVPDGAGGHDLVAVTSGNTLVAFAAPACAAADAAPPSELAQWRVAGVTGELSVQAVSHQRNDYSAEALGLNIACFPAVRRPPARPPPRRPPRATPGCGGLTFLPRAPAGGRLGAHPLPLH